MLPDDPEVRAAYGKAIGDSPWYLAMPFIVFVALLLGILFG